MSGSIFFWTLDRKEFIAALGQVARELTIRDLDEGHADPVGGHRQIGDATATGGAGKGVAPGGAILTVIGTQGLVFFKCAVGDEQHLLPS